MDTSFIPAGIIKTMKEIARLAYELFGIHVSRAQLTALEVYQDKLLEWNTRYNLTAIKEPDKIRVRHFLDSLTCLSVMRGSRMERVIDVGTGAGFPGLPIKIIQPEIQLTLIDSVEKKTDFCQHIVEELQLKGVQVIKSRAEEIGRSSQHRQQYDWALARAVAILPSLLEYLLPLTRVGGAALAMKGESAHSEAHSAENAMRLLGGHLREVVQVHLPGVAEDHYMVVVDKVAATPDEFPRRTGVPAKRPL